MWSGGGLVPRVFLSCWPCTLRVIPLWYFTRKPRAGPPPGPPTRRRRTGQGSSLKTGSRVREAHPEPASGLGFFARHEVVGIDVVEELPELLDLVLLRLGHLD